ncbi:MAG: glycosyltransferase family 87 protein [Deltaproteobacteria bacterium]|nr:glycosyltransferase family 87 protein [Deltaproteobacteria bacterium]
MGLPYPFNTFLFRPDAVFSDFLYPYLGNVNLNPYFSGVPSLRSSYYPFTNIIFYLFSYLPQPHIIMILCFVLAFVYFNRINLKSEDKIEYFSNVFILSFLTYPFLFLIDRGNIEMVVFIFLAVFILLFKREKFFAASIFLTLAIAMKAYPIAFIVLFLDKKRYKNALGILFSVAVLEFVSLLFHQGGLAANLNHVLSGFNIRNDRLPYIGSIIYGNNIFLQRGVSLYTLVKLILIEQNQIMNIDMAELVRIYNIIMGVLFTILSAYILLIEKEFWKKVMLLVIAMLLFPYISCDYKLILLFLPLFLFINSTKVQKSDLFYVIMFSLLLIPKDYFFFKWIYSDSLFHDISIAVPMNILILLGLLLRIMAEGMEIWFNDSVRGRKETCKN